MFCSVGLSLRDPSLPLGESLGIFARKELGVPPADFVALRVQYRGAMAVESLDAGSLFPSGGDVVSCTEPSPPLMASVGVLDKARLGTARN